ncbi:RtcB family protein [Dactylosporangium matsuzakiense]|uniref:tRNA-splicing ligase RtcB n=1 Tax=Dactylosporangium matsuzakiense TaxID=53360 RepID=A0A9W6KSW9_9ACTN|nr:RtcB family protein [Dactylosporangium matsuzakiense]UWZ43856.1 RtcB family protein [Dactylosporangium matsuzakiense]GLL07472.1 RNA-splicing ligase RtcB [Dactylosporangium matsuzakiense]
MQKRTDPRLVRLDESWTSLPNPYDIPVEICASPDVPIEPAALDELLTVLETQRTLETLSPEARIERVVCTPDFHKGAGIPIGTVLQTRAALVPQAVGNDINCGMRVEATSLTVDEVRPHLDDLERRLRHLFFEGGRRIGLTPAQREGLLRFGLPGLLGEGFAGHAVDAADRLHAAGFPADSADGFRDWVTSGGGTSYDSLIGSVGGGNHFAELQYVAAVHDGPTAYAWGLTPGRIVTMVHTGSLALGHQAGATGRDLARKLWPSGVPLPTNGILPILLDKPWQRYLTGFHNAANFAIGNRYFLSQMMRTALAGAVGDLDARLVYDAPHNLLWPSGDTVLHRKGATPAGLSDDGWGEPVIVPGSMGAPSYLLRGLGEARALTSACHGAGRSIPRGAAAKGSDDELDAFLRDFRVVTPLNHRDPAIATRRDIITAWRRDLKQEAPWAYKEVRPVVDSLRTAGVAEPVVELRPLLTVKG